MALPYRWTGGTELPIVWSHGGAYGETHRPMPPEHAHTHITLEENICSVQQSASSMHTVEFSSAAQPVALSKCVGRQT